MLHQSLLVDNVTRYNFEHHILNQHRNEFIICEERNISLDLKFDKCLYKFAGLKPMYFNSPDTNHRHIFQSIVIKNGHHVMWLDCLTTSESTQECIHTLTIFV